jgi:hypothetical protein
VIVGIVDEIQWQEDDGTLQSRMPPHDS